MRVLYLQPSNIRYSQDSINNYFDSKSRHNDTLIGDTLDDLCEGRCRVNDIAKISVVKKNGKWFTADNRRLWVFRHLERLGKCTEIQVYETTYIPDHKFTTLNDGESVDVRRNPGGRWYCKPTPKFNDITSTKTDLSERYTMPEHLLPYSAIQDRLSTQNTAAQKPLSNPPNRDEIQFIANGGMHTETKEPEVQEPRVQVHTTFDHSVPIKSNPRSVDIRQAPIITTSADNHGDDVQILIDELEGRVPDKVKFIHRKPTFKGELCNSGNLDCCLCVIL